MADPEKRKKLEELRRKRIELMNQLKSTNKKQENADNSKSVNQMAREILESTKAVNNFEAKGAINQSENFVDKVMKKNFEKNIDVTRFSDLFPPFKPETYDEETQYYDEKEDEDSDEEKNYLPKKQKMELIIRKNKKINENENKFDNRPKEYKVMTEEEEKIYIGNKKEEGIKELINNQKKYMERALNENDVYDMFISNFEDNEKQSIPNSNGLLYPLVEFFDDYCATKVITSLEYSDKYPELVLAGYSKSNDLNLNEQNGLILLWSLASPKVPEFTFTCQAEVTSACFHAYNPKIVLGGTYTGQILKWDTRGKKMPVDKTPLGCGGNEKSSETHSSAITCLSVIGTTNSNQIVSVSNGSICLWSLSNLSQPVKRIPLKKKNNDSQSELNEIGALSMGVQLFETGSILIGSDDYNIYQVSLHDNEYRNSDYILSTFKGHEGPVFSLDPHPTDYYNTCDFSHLFVSSGADWTTRIWTKQRPDKPLLVLDNYEDYVYCSKWCPTNSSVLCCTDGGGKLDLWNLNKDNDIPQLSINLGPSVINKIAWSDDGKRLALGDSSGKVKIVGLSQKVYKSRPEDSANFEKNILKILKEEN